jgi:WD40 repeat protein
MSEDNLYPILRDLAFAPRLDRTGQLAPGERVGRFEVLREIDRGSFGLVYEARDTELGRHVAIKVLRFAFTSESGDQALLVRLRREAEAAARLSHPNVVTLHDFGTHAGLPFLVFELLAGETLRSRLRSGTLPLRDALDIAAQVARGLAHAHEAAIVHRDLNPNNIFLLPDGRVKLLDFGLARLRETLAPEPAPAPGQTAGAGTPGYMAPEQWRGQAASALSDVFSAGVVLYEMLAGRPPFTMAPDGTSTVTDAAEVPVLTEVPREVAAIVAHALRKAPKERFESAAAMLAAILEAQEAQEEPLTGGDPYRYLDAFTEADEAWFFGRARESARLRGMLATHPLVCVLGPSGAGKSSLVQAGLFPRLRREGWEILHVRPGPDPLGALREQVRRRGEEALELEEKPAALGTVLRDLARKKGARLLLFVDQLEELYTREVRPEARAAFAASLLAAADDVEGPVRVVATLREDHLSRLSETPALRDEISQSLLLLGPPDAEGLLEALRGPARRLGYELEEGLAEEIVQALSGDLRQPLPLLQLTASRLWERRDVEKRRLSREALGALRGIAGIIATHAEEVFQTLGSSEDRRTAREILLALVSPERTARAEQRGHLLGRFADPTAAARVLEHLLRGRLVIASPAREGGEERVSLAHEALLSGWDRLDDWLDALKDERKIRDRLSSAAAQWIAENRSKEALWMGRRLREELARAARYAEPLSAPEREFLETARSRRTKRRLGWTFSLLAAAGLTAVLAAYSLRFYRTGEGRLAEAASRARQTAIVAAAAGAEDPLTGALLLAELGGGPEPPGGMRAARRIAAQSLPLHVLRGHAGPVRSVRFDRRGAALVTSSFDGTVRIWRADGTGAPTLLQGGTAVSSMAVREDGAVAAGFEDAQVRVWRPGEASTPTLLKGHRAAVTQVSFSRDGSRLLSASRDGTARIWHLGGTAAPLVLRGHAGSIRAAVFDAQGARVVTASDDGTARMWRADGAGSPVILRGDGSPILVAAFHPDGARVITGSQNGTVRSWPADGRSPPLVWHGHRGAITSLDFAPGREAILTGSEDGTARIWRPLGKGDPIILGGHARAVRGAHFSPDGRRVVTASDDGTARLWTVDSSESPVVLKGHSGPVAAAVFSTDGTLVATASHDATVRLWPTAGPHQPLVLRLPGKRSIAKIVDAHFAKTGAYLLTQNSDGTVGVWRNGAAEPMILGRTSGVIFDTFMSSDARYILAVAAAGEALLWRATGGPPTRLVGHEADVMTGSFNSDGTRVVTASRDRTARIWRTDGQGPPIVLRGHEHTVSAAVFTPDDRSVITGAWDSTIRIWRADGKGEPRILRGHKRNALRVDFSPDGTRFVTASFDHTARIWPLRGPSESSVILRGHGGPLESALFSPDGTRIVTGSHDRTARVWRSDGSGEPVILAGHEGAVYMAKFSPDGTRVITSGADRIIRLWRADGVGEPEQFPGADTDFSPDGSLIVAALMDGTANVWIVDWRTLLQELRSWTTACLKAEERGRFLAETPPEARARYEACERRAGRPTSQTPVVPLLPKDPADSVLEPDTDIWSANFRDFDLQTPDPGPCRKQCIEGPRCRAFTVSPPGSMGPKARCFLKDGPIERRQYSPGSVSGVVR